MKRSVRVAVRLLAATALTVTAKRLVAVDYDGNPQAPASSSSVASGEEQSDTTQRSGFGTSLLYAAVAGGTIYLMLRAGE
jgi:hypothetical protein